MFCKKYSLNIVQTLVLSCNFNLLRKNFIHKNEDFECLNCHEFVKAGEGFIRNHCPFCLHCLHVDKDVPGDRASDCGALMKPVGLKNVRIGEFKIVFECTACDHKYVNKVLPDDNMDLVIELSHKPYQV